MSQKSNAQRLIELFGGPAKMAKATGLDPAIISRLVSHGPRGCGGIVPVRYFDNIMDAARKLKFPAQAKLYMEGLCPLCKQPVKAK